MAITIVRSAEALDMLRTCWFTALVGLDVRLHVLARGMG